MHSRRGPKAKRADSKPAPVAVETSDSDKPERIAKRMARAGLCSRREAETWIAAGRVEVNGKVLETPAFTVTLKDKIEVDGNLISSKERTRLWLFHKPAGTVTTNRDPEGRKTVFETLPDGLPRLLSVGRLDINTEGLLLMTNDGGLSRELELPTTGWLRRYRVRVHGKVNEQELEKLKDGIAVDGVLYGAIDATLEHVQGTNSWLSVSLREGKNREIKNVLGHLGLNVSRLIRISFGPFQLGDLPTGAVREIRSRMLREQLGNALIERSGADFDAPIINLAPEVARSASKAAEQGSEKSRKSAKPKEKLKRGGVRSDTLSRLTTSKENDGGKKRGSRNNSSSKGGSARNRGKR